MIGTLGVKIKQIGSLLFGVRLRLIQPEGINKVKSEKQIKREYYDRFYRDQRSKTFYQSAEWRHLRDLKLTRDPLCQACEQAGRTVKADLPHHIFKITTPEGWEHRLDITFLLSVCHPCHNAIESEMEKDANKQ